MHRARWQWLLAVCALWMAGCTCGTPPVESSLTVAFEQPVDGQRLALGDDADPAAEGFQYDVVAVAADSAGRAVTLSTAKLEVQLAGESDWRAGPAAVLEGQRVRFPGVTLPGRTNVLRVSVEEQGSKRTATNNQSVTVGVEPPGLEIVSPVEGQVLREADDAEPLQPGYQVAFELRATGLRRASGLISCAGVCGIAPVPFTVGDDGKASARVTLSEPVREAQLSQCVAVVKRSGGDVTSPARGLTFDTEGPRLALASPVSAVTTPTFKVEAVVRSAEDGATATLSRSGATALTTTVRAGLATFSEVTVPGDGSHDFLLSITDSGGNVTEKPLAVVVASALPAPVLVVPDKVTTSTAGQPAVAEAVVKLDDQPVGTEVELWTTVTGRLGQPQRARTVEESGVGRVARFPLSLAEGSNSVKACVRNVAGSQVCRLATTQVQTGRPDCRIVEPAPGSVLPAGGNPVVVRVEALNNNGPVLLSAQGPGATENVPGTASGGAASVSLNLSGDGAWKLVASCAGGAVSQAVTVSRDTSPPTLAVTVRDAPEGRIEPSFVDTSPLPGTQVVLEAVTEPFAQVLVQGCGLPATLTASAEALGRATLRDVTVPASGSCSFSARAVDLAGNEASVEVPVSSAFAVSSLTFASPDASRTLGPADGTALDGNLLVPMTLAFSAGAVGELKLFRDTAQVASSAVTDADTGKTFSGVQLADGVNVLRAVLVNGAGAGACASALYTVDTSPGAITLTSPGASTTYNLGSDRDPTTPGIQHPLAYSLNGASPSATVDVCTSIALTPAATPCRDGSGWFTLASGVPDSTALFSYPDGKYSLKVVLDDGGHLDESAPVSLLVDGRRPEVTALEFKGDVNGDRRVNATEWPSGAPVLARVHHRAGPGPAGPRPRRGEEHPLRPGDVHGRPHRGDALRAPTQRGGGLLAGGLPHGRCGQREPDRGRRAAQSIGSGQRRGAHLLPVGPGGARDHPHLAGQAHGRTGGRCGPGGAGLPAQGQRADERRRGPRWRLLEPGARGHGGDEDARGACGDPRLHGGGHGYAGLHARLLGPGPVGQQGHIGGQAGEGGPGRSASHAGQPRLWRHPEFLAGDGTGGGRGRRGTRRACLHPAWDGRAAAGGLLPGVERGGAGHREPARRHAGRVGAGRGRRGQRRLGALDGGDGDARGLRRLAHLARGHPGHLQPSG